MASSNDADAPPVATTGLSSGSTSTGGCNYILDAKDFAIRSGGLTHHHAPNPLGPNGGGHNNNYRGMNGGKGNRSQVRYL